MYSKGLLLKIEILPGKDDEAERFFHQNIDSMGDIAGLNGTFIIRFGRSDYGVFASFTDLEHREEFMKSALYDNIKLNEEILFHSHVYNSKLEILAEKLPSGEHTKLTKALMLSFKAKKGHEEEVETYLKNSRSYIMDEQETLAWFAIKYEDGAYGIFGAFPDNGGRFKHLVGHVPKDLLMHSFSMLGGIPDMDLLRIV